MSELRFDGKVVVVTGAGAGLGRSHALLFARRGAKVVVNDLGGSASGQGQSATAADKVVAEIRAAGGTAVANYDSVERGEKIIKTAIDAFGRIDVLVNNAGILRDVSFHKMTKEDWDLIVKVHLHGAYACTQAAWPHMRDQGYGRILFTASAAGIYGNFGQANYSMAKLGLVGLANTLAIEGEKKNVRVNTIAPVAASRMTETILSKDLLENLKPEYVTPLVAWLAHENCTETGGLFEVGGGFFAKLRWERSGGRTFKLGRELSPELVQNQWEQIVDFSHSTHPENVTSALAPVMANLGTKSKGGNEFIDVDLALGAKLPEATSRYDERDLALYALGIGAGQSPTDPSDLHVVWERHAEGFYALPTFGVISPLNALFQGIAEGKSAPGLNYSLDRILHGEHYTELTRPLPPHAELIHKTHIADIWDKGKNAVVVIHIDSHDSTTGELLVKNDLTLVIRGAGGWGGDRGPSSDINVPPPRPPDAVIVQKTTENQALLYRLSGDWNPLHVDPEFATMFGFDKPILHGLCTFGFAGRAVINAFCKGDPRYFKSIKVRFAESVFPGETLKVEMWKESDLRILVRVSVVEREKVCLTNAAVELYPEIPKPQGKRETRAPSVATAVPSPANDMTSALSFQAIGAYLSKNSEFARSVGNLFQFHLKKPDSSWVLDLKNGTGSTKPGIADKADCTLTMDDADWLDIVSGKADSMKLFTSGKLKVTGNVMAAQKLDFLKKIDRKDFEAALGNGPAPAASTSSAAASAELKAPKIITALRERLTKTPQLAKELEAVISFKVTDGPSFTIDPSATPPLRDGADAKATTTITLSDSALSELVGSGALQRLYQLGELRVDGAMKPVHRLVFLKQVL